MLAKTVSSFVVLMSLAAGACVAKQQPPDCIDGRPDPLDRLNRLMESLSSVETLVDNVGAVRAYVSSAAFQEQTDEGVRKAILSYSQLLPELKHICEPNNLRLLRELNDLSIGCPESEHFLDHAISLPRRLYSQLMTVAWDARSTCFGKFQREWPEMKASAELVAELRKYFAHFNLLTEKHTDEQLLSEIPQVKQLNGAVEWLRKQPTGDLFSGSDLKQVLQETHKQLTGDSELKLGADEVARLVQAYLIEPCKRLLARSDSAAMLEAALNLGRVVPVSDSISWPFDREVFVWAAHYGVCQRLAPMEPAALAKMVLA